MSLTVSANIDSNIVSGLYRYFFSAGEFHTVVDVTLNLKHETNNENGSLIENTLMSQTFDQTIVNEGGLPGEEGYLQYFDYSFLNPNYYDNLFVEVIDNRTTGATTLKVPVLEDGEINLPNNPIKEPEHVENEAENEPDKNVVISDPEVSVVKYSLASDPVNIVFSQDRIIELNNSFVVYPEQREGLLVEGFTRNYIPDPYFQTDNNIEIDAKGFAITEKEVELLEGFDGKFIRLQNTSYLSAFDAALITYYENVEIPTGLNFLTFSFFYKLFGTTIPVENITLRIKFFENDVFLTEKESMVAAQAQDEWGILSVTANSIPLTANKANFEIELDGIDSPEKFELDLFGLQLEPVYTPTSRIMEVSRVQDKVTTKPLDLNLPLNITARVEYSGQGVRGFVDSKSAGTGIQFFSSGNDLVFKQFNAGAVVHNISTALSGLTVGNSYDFTMFLTETELKFLVEGSIVATFPGSYSFDQQDVEILIGSLSQNHSAINKKLENLIISSELP